MSSHTSGPAMRRRPIDNLKKIPILRDIKGLVFEEEHSDELAQAKKKKIIDLPVPFTSDVTDYAQFTSGGFKPPLAYVRRAPPRDSDDDASAEYDLAWEDEAWLAKHAKYGPSAADERTRLSAATLERMLGVLEVLSGAHGFPLTAAEAVAQVPDRVRRIKDAAGKERFPFPPAVPVAALVEDVFKHWMDRRNKLKKPLLRRFWPQTSVTDTCSDHCFRPFETQMRATRARTRKNDSESLNKLALLSQELHAGLELAEMVSQREAMKRDLIAVAQDMFDQAIYDAVDTSGVARKPASLDLTDQTLQAPRKVKLRLKGTGSFRPYYQPTPYVTLGPDGLGDEGEAADGSFVVRRKATGHSKARREAAAAASAAAAVAAGSAGGASGGGTQQRQGGVLVRRTTGGSAGARKDSRPRAAGGRVGPAGSTAVAGMGCLNGTGGIATGSMWPYGLRSDAMLMGGGVQSSFGAGHRGFALGPWAPPRTVFPHHVDQALLAPEDPLRLAQGLGMRMGVSADPSSALANACGMSNPNLPSQSTIFPMDELYCLPASDEVYRGDVTIQRRMLIARRYFGMSAPGLSWEGHTGSGLVEGVGAGLSRDGRGWEDIGLMAGTDVLPFDGEDATGGDGGVVAALLRATSVRRGGGTGAASAVAARPAVGAPTAAAASGPAPGLTAAAADQDKKRSREAESDLNEDEQDEDDVDRRPAPLDVLLRLRFGRGCRLIVDRIPAAAAESLVPRVAAAATQLAQRKRARLDAQRHAWASLTSLKSPSSVELAVASFGGDPVRLSAADVDVPSSLALRRLYGVTSDVADSASLHLRAFRGYGMAVGSGDVENQCSAGSTSARVPGVIPGSQALQVTKRGLSTGLLAESCYTRSGGAMPLQQTAASDASDGAWKRLAPGRATDDEDASAEMAAFLASLQQPAGGGGCGASSELAALADRLQAAVGAKGGKDASSGRPAPAPRQHRVLGASGSAGWVPAHSVKAAAAKLFGGGARPIIPNEHAAFIEGSSQRSGLMEDDPGQWRPVEQSVTLLAAAAGMTPQRFSELWEMGDSDSEDLVTALYSSAPRVAGYERTALASFTEAQSRLLVAAVPVDGS